jgi:hypothetical protein
MGRDVRIDKVRAHPIAFRPDITRTTIAFARKRPCSYKSMTLDQTRTPDREVATKKKRPVSRYRQATLTGQGRAPRASFARWARRLLAL